MPVSHVFSCTIADDPIDAAAGKVLPSHWDSAHFVSLATDEVIKWASAGTSSISSGTLAFGNSNGITFGMSNGTITATVVPGAAAGIAAIQGGTQTATSGTVLFADSNGITFGMSGSTRITASHNALTSQSNQALSGSNGSFAFQTATFGNLNGMSFYTNNGSLVGSYTVPATAGLLSNINVSAGTTSNNLSAIVFSDSNNVSFGLNGSTITGTATFAQSNQSAIKALGASNTGNTAGNTGLSTGIDWVFAGTNGITVSESTAAGGPNTLWLSGVTTAAQTNQSAIKAFGASNTGNTAGNTGVSTGIDWVLAGTNNITISESTAGGGPNTLWISGAAGGAGDGYNIIAAGTQTAATTGTVVFSNSNGVTFGMSNSSIVTGSVAANYTHSLFEPDMIGSPPATAISDGTLWMRPIYLPGYLSCSVAVLPMSLSLSTSSNSSHAGVISAYIGIFTKNGSTLSLASSGSQSYQWSNTSNNSTSIVQGRKVMTVPFNVNATPGDYYVGLIYRSSTTNANWFTASAFAAFGTSAALAFNILLVANNASNALIPGYGQGTVSTAAMPNSIAFSDMTAPGGAAPAFPHFGLANFTI